MSSPFRLLAVWLTGSAYKTNDVVIHPTTGDRYVALKDHVARGPNMPGTPDGRGLWDLFIKAGKPGKDGKDADPAVLERMVLEAVARLPKPKDGEPGKDGRDGIGLPGEPGKNGQSIKGDPGEPGSTGEPGVRWRGQYKNTGIYSVGDLVRVGPGNDGISGGVYICVKDGVKLRPPYPGWEIFVADGVRGGGSGSSFTGTIAADHVTYTTAGFSTVQQALDSLLYVSPQITSFTNNVGTVELGLTITDVLLSWSYNKTMATQSIDQGIGAISPTSISSYDVSSVSLTSDTTWTLTASDGTSTVTRQTSVLFRRKRYWGASALTSLTSSDILALGGSEFATDFNKSVSYDCTGGKYPYFCYPASFGTPASVTVGGLPFSDFSVTAQSFTNASGHSESYNVIRFNGIQTGAAINVHWQ
jgi:hypothetical protein